MRRVSGDYVSLCFHSTPEFAKRYEYVYGSTSAAAKLAADKWASDDNKKKEQQVGTHLPRLGLWGLGIWVGGLSVARSLGVWVGAVSVARIALEKCASDGDKQNKTPEGKQAGKQALPLPAVAPHFKTTPLSSDGWVRLQVLAELMQAGTAFLEKRGCALPAPAFGPLLHRWGSAFTYSPDAPRADEQLRIAVCGDFAGQTELQVHSGVEAAAVM